MKHQIEFKDVESTEKIRKLIESRIAHIERLSRGLRADPQFLRCAVEEVPAHKRFRISVTFEVPLKTLVAKNESHDVEAGIRAAFDEIEKQLEAYKSDLRGEHWWKRVQRRREIARLKAGVQSTPAEESPQWFFSLVEPHLATVREVAGHVLRFAEARGDLPAHELELDEVVDAALARAYDEFAKESKPENIRSRLVWLALDEIKKEVKRAKTDRERMVHVQEDVPENPQAQEFSTLGDDILDFYQPDEHLKIEDVIPEVSVPSPEEIAETEELRNCVRRALGELPKEARAALLLRYVVGLRGKELAYGLHTTEAEARRLLESARQHLRERLVASGCTLKPTTPVASRT